ncbi:MULTISPECIES: crotonase/enoyl-CoA hydratase family protein [unclassified Methylophaga]|jgi:DSF synthase|uniref:crotonase/enoyl-CoA hydratase family protein n=1 Tax=unclassified Methylophaga TaxID=2629249 RepID=UPI00259C7B56|nr:MULTISPECIES: crotonase/enoyl-CoA hydratase family protein [unclassified Methylophaga]|tara:strand:- start:7506 stop:8396 length:891 start_codon:yes stop_codon:yes gene_type:complete
MNALAKMDDAARLQHEQKQFSQLSTHYDRKYRTGWFRMHGEPRPCFTPTLLSEIASYFSSVKQDMRLTQGQKYDYLVLASDVEGIFNLGGDLGLFSQLIERQDADGLLEYAVSCINVLHANMSHLDSDLTTIALVKGDALGGGFESALSSNVLIAEKGAKLGLPEVLFNLFPGMGAFSLLSRKIGASKAEKMILEGKLYSAEELYEIGVVDILAEKGQGELEVYRYIDKANKNVNSRRAMRQVKDACNAVSYDELLTITKIWVDAALKLEPRDLRMMQRLVQRQTSKVDLGASVNA